jgi:hypothetical protein
MWVEKRMTHEHVVEIVIRDCPNSPLFQRKLNNLKLLEFQDNAFTILENGIFHARGYICDALHGVEGVLWLAEQLRINPSVLSVRIKQANTEVRF